MRRTTDKHKRRIATAWRKANRARVKAHARKTYLKYRERYLAEQRARYTALSEEERREYQRRKYKAAKKSQQEYRERNKDRRYIQTAAWREKNLSQILYYSAKHRASRYDLEFDLVPSDIVIPERCPVFGREFVRGKGRGLTAQHLIVSTIQKDMCEATWL